MHFAVYIQERASKLMVVHDAEDSMKERKAAGRSQAAAMGRRRCKTYKRPPSAPFRSTVRLAERCSLDLHVVFDLCIVSDAADGVPSGEHLMGDHPPEAASLSPDELSRVLLAIVTRDLLSNYGTMEI